MKPHRCTDAPMSPEWAKRPNRRAMAFTAERDE